MKTPNLPQVWAHRLNQQGFLVVQQCNIPKLLGYLTTLGTVVHECVVQINSHSKSYLSGFNPVPPHTDHPSIKWIAWLCIEQDKHDGANLLFDSRELISQLNQEELDLLTDTKIGMPLNLASLNLDGHFPIYNKTTHQFYYADWLIDEQSKNPILKNIILKLKELILERSIKVHLQPSQALIIDNQRLLHYRDGISIDSCRKLHRFWIA